MMMKLMRNCASVILYDDCKYNTAKEFKRIEYRNCIGYEVVQGEQAREIENLSDGSCIDPYHEYLILYFADGDTATFRNSFVDMFSI